MSDSPASPNHTTSDTLRSEGAPSAGRIHPHSDERSTAMMTNPIAAAHNTDPSQSSCGRTSLGASATRRASSRMPAPTSTSPANTTRQDA